MYIYTHIVDIYIYIYTYIFGQWARVVALI